MLKKLNALLSGVPMTMIGGVFLLMSLVLPKAGVRLPMDPAWISIMISGIPLLYLAAWRVIHNPGISKISSALLIVTAMLAAIAIGYLFAAGEVAFIMAIGAILEDKTTDRAKKGLKKLVISQLTAMNTRTVLLTGDNQKAADYFAGRAGITEVHAQLLPEEKVQSIEKLHKDKSMVCMIGVGAQCRFLHCGADCSIAA